MRCGSWHDFFNNLSWLLFPNAKMALVERLTFAEKNRTPEDTARGQFRSREGDRLAMFDEGGVLSFGGYDDPSQTFVFGHALQEAFVNGHYDVRAMKVETGASLPQEDKADLLLKQVDQLVAAALRAGLMSSQSPAFASCYLRELLPHPRGSL